MNEKSLKTRFSRYIADLQDSFCGQLEESDGGARFSEDVWQREGGGGGHTRILERGDLIEKGGVNISTVHGELPEPVRTRFEVDRGWFWAGGFSTVIHPVSPMIPTVHANIRYFELYDDPDMKEMRDCWFGGGADLTPYYLWDEDAVYFHRVLKETCDSYGKELYPQFKAECDSYFYNEHRQEARGVGGIFFDYLRPSQQHAAEERYAFTAAVGGCLAEAWLPIAERRRRESYDERHRYFQEIRRGRYVEFNLIHDRGTLFGLKTGGRTESILMSLPPRVRWDYGETVEADSREAYLLGRLKHPVDWISIENQDF